MSEEIFHISELTKPYDFPNNQLPTIHDCILFVLSRTHKHSRCLSHQEAVWKMAVLVEEIWTKADCCPYSAKHIYDQLFKKTWDVYTFLVREKSLPGEKNVAQKRSHKKNPNKIKDNKEPVRKSSRTSSPGSSSQCIAAETSEEQEASLNVPSSCKSTKTRSKNTLRQKWDSFAEKLFDVKSSNKVNNSDCFDESFYLDQSTSRSQIMYLAKVTKEYVEEEKIRKKKEAAKQKRKESAYANFSVVTENEVENEEDVSDVTEDAPGDEDCEESFMKSPLTHQESHVVARRSLDSKSVTNAGCKGGIQISNLPVRVELVPGSAVYSDIEPRYLKAMSLIMAENMSASEAVKVVYICDTTIHGLTRHLPLHLDKLYLNSCKRLKRLVSNAKKERNKHHSLTPFYEDVSEELHDSEDGTFIDDDGAENQSEEIMKLKETVRSIIEIRKKDKGNVLPDPICVRKNHNLISVYCESKIADEIIEKKAFIIPDGTSRQGVGDMAAAVVKVGDHIRALKATKIGKGDRENWAAAIYHMLDRLAAASSKDITTIWESIVAMLSDLCKVNLDLANEVKKLVGVEWLPGQVFCNLHYTLAIPEGIKKVLTTYQCLIGADKLFPKNVSFEMNIEDKLVVIQVLDCWMRLTSIRWQSKPWNRYSNFTEYAERRGIKNVGHMLHSNRFGEFEERCAGGLYLVETWKQWLACFTDVRNQLGCYLRSVMSILGVCKFLWAGAALIGIHVTSPFMSMLLDYKVTPLKLLDVLPKLHHDLHSYPISLAQLTECGIPSLKEFFPDPLQKETTPYGVEVCKCLQQYLEEECDKDMMNRYLTQICTELGIILKRQRGNQYGFGDDPDSPAHIRKNMTDAMLNDPDANHSKPIENFFGNMDREIKKSGPQGFDKCASDLIIKYGKDLVGDNDNWRSKANKAAAKILTIKQKEFDKKQEQLIKNGVNEADATHLCSANQVIKCLAQCKASHDGPLVTIEELHKLVDEKKKKKDKDKELHKALNLEIRFRKFTLTEVKNTCPLFRQKGLTVEQKVKNLESLIDSQLDFKVLADMDDLESAIDAAGQQQIQVTEHAEETVDNEEQTSKKNEKSTKHKKTTETPTQSPQLQNINVEDFVLGLFDDGSYPAEVLSIVDDSISLSCMEPVVIQQQRNFRFWKWPSTVDEQTINIASVLPIRPSLDVAAQFSSRRNVVFELLNFELVKNFAE